MKQERALTHLLAGATVTEAASAAGVGRSTLHRWLVEDLTFVAAYNRGRSELRGAVQGRLLRLSERALDTVEGAVEDGDVRTSLKILDGLGLLRPPTIGPADVEALEFQRKQEENTRASEEWMANLQAALR